MLNTCTAYVEAEEIAKLIEKLSDRQKIKLEGVIVGMQLSRQSDSHTAS